MDKYVIYDAQCGRLMGDTDETPLTFSECVDYLISYHSIDHTKRELKDVRRCYEINKEYAEIEIIKESDHYGE